MEGKIAIIEVDRTGADLVDTLLLGMASRTIYLGCPKSRVDILRKYPSVGDTIAILHSVKRNSTGEVLGVHRADSVAVDTISAVYLDGTVRVGTSDTWEVKFASGESKATKGAKWATVNPMHGRG